MPESPKSSTTEVPTGAIFLPENKDHQTDAPDIDALIGEFLSLDWEQSEAPLDQLVQAHAGSPRRLYDRLQFALLACRGGIEDHVSDEPELALIEIRTYQYGLVNKRRRLLAQAAMQ